MPLKNLLNLTHTSHILAASRALMSRYSKPLKERRFPQDVATVAYVSLCVWSSDTLRAFHKRLVLWKYRNLWIGMYGPLFVYRLRYVDIKGCWLGRQWRQQGI